MHLFQTFMSSQVKRELKPLVTSFSNDTKNYLLKPVKDGPEITNELKSNHIQLAKLSETKVLMC